MRRFQNVDFRLVYRSWDNFKSIGESLDWHDTSLEFGAWELVNFTHDTHEYTNVVVETIPYTMPYINDKVHFIRLSAKMPSVIKLTNGYEQQFGCDDDEGWLDRRINELIEIMEKLCT